MSTRARIGIVRSYDADENPKTVESIYHHTDGYPSWLGAKLLVHWTDAAKVEALIDLGDVATGAPTVEAIANVRSATPSEPASGDCGPAGESR